jgi:hypothetical protein
MPGSSVERHGELQGGCDQVLSEVNFEEVGVGNVSGPVRKLQ